MSRQNMVRSPGGTITRTVFNVGPALRDGLPTAVYIGTADAGATESDPTGGGAPGNNMVVVSESEYDNGAAGGDGLLSKDTKHVDDTTTRETVFLYDWRHRQTDIDGEEDSYQKNFYDNLDRVTRVDRHDTTSTGNLIARSETLHDDLGSVYRSKRYAVDPSTGTVGNALTDNTWYDEAGNAVKQMPAGSQAFTKTQYDSLGRQAKAFIGFDVDESSHAEALGVVGDTIFEQSETAYDDASNVMQTTLRRRHHDATGSGELTESAGTQPRARVSYVAFYVDALGRQIAVANYGTNGDTALSRSSTIPARGDDVLVTSTEYNDAGEPYKTIDPADKEDRTEFDAAGRVIRSIENYTDGDPTTGGNDEDVTVEFTYTPDGQQATNTAKQKDAADDQTTQYVYGTTLADSSIARNDLLRAVIYPDSDDSGIGVPPVLSEGADGIYDRVEHKYNRRGELIETKDQNETVHAFDYDDLGRQTHDRVTSLGAGIDGAVRRISTSYTVLGQLEKVTSYDNAAVGSGDVVNEVVRQYNDASLLDREYQEHNGAKDANTPYVGYNYDQTASGGEFTKGLRPMSVRYPNGRLVHYAYGSSGSDADNLRRLDTIKDDSSGSPGATLASYTYLGAGMVVIEDLEQPHVKRDYFGGVAGSYAGLDRFDRVIDHRWHDHGAGEDRDRFKYGYDRDSNRIWKENVVAKSLAIPVYLDEFYTYDDMHRLRSFDRGQLNTPQTGITGTPVREEDWTLDPLGNWSNYVQKTGSATDLDQNRVANRTNEIINIAETTGTAWRIPSYDRNGNMTAMPQPSDLANSFDCTWDAWNRLVKVKDEPTLIAEYAYDGLLRRVTKTIDSRVRHFLYSHRWQVLEERLDSSADADCQFVWGALYVDHLILRDRDTSEPTNAVVNERIYVLQDANWNVSCLTNVAGDPIERIIYSPYGTATTFDSSYGPAPSTNFDWDYRFTGRRTDMETKLQYYRTRYLHPDLSQFLSRDTMGDQMGPNLLAYVRARPTTHVDPLGTRDCYCSPANCKSLLAINGKLNANITRWLQGWGGLSGADHHGMVDPTPSTVLAPRHLFGRDMPDTGPALMTYIETWVRSLGTAYYYDGHRLKKSLGFVDTADCVKLTCFGVTKCIGTDKLGHMFQQGYMYYEIAKAKGEAFATAFGEWTEDLYEYKPVNPILRRAGRRNPVREVRDWLREGTFSFWGFDETSVAKYKALWGNVKKVGQKSHEDLKANLSGMLFYDTIERESRAGTLSTFTFDICDFVRPRSREPHTHPISGSRYEPGIHQIPMLNQWWWQEEY